MFDVARLSRENTLLNKRKRYSIKRVKTIKGDIMRDWSGEATKLFKDKVVSHIRYTNAENMLDLIWNTSAPIVFFTDGSYLMASADDEGNSGGAFFTGEDEMEIIPRGGQ